MKTFKTVFLAFIVAVAASYGVLKLHNSSEDVSRETSAQKESAHDRVLGAGTIKCGYAMSPPALMKDPNTGRLSGLNYDLWSEIGKELGLQIRWSEETGWGNYIEGLNSGRFDVFCSQVRPNPGRIKHSTMAGPVIYNVLKAYVRPEEDRFDGNLAAINSSDVKIPVIDGDVSVSMAQNRFPKAALHTLPQMATVSDMFMSVVSGKADVIFLDESFYQELSRQRDGALRQVRDVPPIFVYGSYFSLRPGEYALRDMIEVALRRIIDDGRMEKLARKYSQHYYVPPRNYKSLDENTKSTSTKGADKDSE